MRPTTSAVAEPTIPSSDDQKSATTANRLLSPHLKAREGVRFRISDADKKTELVLPPMVVRLLAEILKQVAAGHAVTLMPIHAELTTQEAANLLNVSRPFVVQLIDENRLPARKVGTHRRILFADLMKYRQLVDSERSKALDKLTKQAQKLKLGY